MTVQCSDVPQSLCPYFRLNCNIQNTTDLTDAKKASFHLTFYFFFPDPICKLLVQGCGNGNRYEEREAPYTI